MNKFLHLVLVALVLCCTWQCKKEKEVSSVKDALSYIGADVQVTQADTAAVYHFTKICKDADEARTKLRTLIAAIDGISTSGKPIEKWDSPSTYHYIWVVRTGSGPTLAERNEYMLFFTLQGSSLTGDALVFPQP